MNVKYALIPVVHDLCPAGQLLLNGLNWALGKEWVIPILHESQINYIMIALSLCFIFSMHL